MRDLGSIPGLGRSPGGGNGYTLQYSRLENPHGQRSQAGYSPWGRKQSHTTEQLGTRSTEIPNSSGDPARRAERTLCRSVMNSEAIVEI